MKVKDLETFLHNLGYLSEETARVKLDEKGNIEYIRIDNRKFTNPYKMGEQIIRYTEKIRKARDKARAFKKLSDLPEHISDDIVRYHPSWIKLRENTGYLNDYIEEGEIKCVKASKDKFKSYKEWMSDMFVAIGEKEYYPKKLNPNAEISEEVFESIIRPEVEKSFNQDECLHQDTQAFLLTTQWKRVIERNSEANFKGIRVKLEENSHFPIIVAGTNKRRRSFDFRKPLAVGGFINHLASKNPGNQDLKVKAKQFKKIRGFY